MAQTSFEVGEQLRGVLRAINHDVTDKLIAARGGPKPATMTNLRGTHPMRVRRGTLEALDRGFGWRRGTAEALAGDRHEGLVWHLPADVYEQMHREGMVDYGPFEARPVDDEDDARYRRVAAAVAEAVSAIRNAPPAGEGPAAEQGGLVDSERRMVGEAARLLAQAAEILAGIAERTSDDAR